jgi:hypothetical protein
MAIVKSSSDRLAIANVRIQSFLDLAPPREPLQ